MLAVSYLSHFIHCIVGMALVDQVLSYLYQEKNYFVIPPCDQHKEILTVRVS